MKKLFGILLILSMFIATGLSATYPVVSVDGQIGTLSLNDPYVSTNYVTITNTFNKTNLVIVAVPTPVYTTNYVTLTNIVQVYKTNNVYVTNYPPVVVIPNKLPIVALTSPTNGQVFVGNSATVTANVTATDVDGSISKVEFYVDGTLESTDTTAPYSYTSLFGQGSYSLQAKGYDNSNAVVTSTAASILITNTVVPPITNPPVANAVYVRAGSAGNGSDWANALNALPATLVRGNTYYIGAGSYAGATLSTPDSGTTFITIKKATVAEHGSNNGWVDTYASQATWTSGFTVKSSYWKLDGSIGSLSTNPADYGFTFAQLSGVFVVGNTVGPSYSNIQISHIASKAVASDIEKMFYQNGYQVGAINNVTINHCLLDGWQGGMMARGQGGAACNNWVFEYNICLNGYSSTANHGEWINPNSAPINAMTIRYNVFAGRSGAAGQTGTIVANNSTFGSGLIYGNVFYNVVVGNGVISGTSAGNINNTKVYNNTFVGSQAATGNALSGPGSGNVAANNLYYNASTGVNSFTETDRLVSTTDPLVDFVNFNFDLKAPTKNGLALPAPFNIDAYGRVRGADGIWDIGAMEFSQ